MAAIDPQLDAGTGWLDRLRLALESERAYFGAFPMEMCGLCDRPYGHAEEPHILSRASIPEAGASELPYCADIHCDMLKVGLHVHKGDTLVMAGKRWPEASASVADVGALLKIVDAHTEQIRKTLKLIGRVVDRIEALEAEVEELKTAHRCHRCGAMWARLDGQVASLHPSPHGFLVISR